MSSYNQSYISRIPRCGYMQSQRVLILQGATDHCHLIANRSLHGYKCYISAFTPFKSLQPC